ncbi:uncharacterized protein LOC142368495 [Odontesthes bonariensis]|uniref:uncharacterized protein LOC142368495 n=1 Tax=Odontesthes bonariensis TaxID=219752 RepID=UPI003F581F45
MTKDFREAVQRFANDDPRGESIDRNLKDLFENLLKQTTSTREILTTLRIDRVYEQCDAAEYFERILKLTSPKAAKIFHGKLSHTTTCSRCKSETYRDGRFWHLPLGLVDSSAGDYSVEDGIKEFFKGSEFSGENQMYCEQCDTKVDATARNVVEHHPDVLILLLKRFDFSYRHMSYVKINAVVDVPFTLKISENQTYELYAVVEHFGDLTSGHYTATIKSPDDEDRWYNFNDTWITPLDVHSLKSHENIIKSQSAYLLFYRKKDTVTQEFPINEGPPLTSILTDTDEASDGFVAGSIKRNEDITEALSADPCCNVDPETTHSFPDDLVRKQERDEAKIMRADEDRGGNILISTEANPKDQVPENAELVISEERNSDVNHDVKPAVIEQPNYKQDDMSNAEGGVFDAKTDENEQTEKKEKVKDAVDDHSKGFSSVQTVNDGSQSDGEDDNLKPADVNKKGDERMKTVVKDQKEGATEAAKLKPEKQRLLTIYDLCRPDHVMSSGDREQNVPKDDQSCEENFDKDRDDRQKKSEQSIGFSRGTQKDDGVEKRAQKQDNEEHAGATHTQSGSDIKGGLTGNQGAQRNEKTRSEILQPNTRGGLFSGVQDKREEESLEVLSGGNRSTATENIIATVEEISFGSINKQAENNEGNTERKSDRRGAKSSFPTPADGIRLNESHFPGKAKKKVSDAKEKAVGMKYTKYWGHSATLKLVRKKDKDRRKDRRKHLGVFLPGKDRKMKTRIKRRIRMKSTPS